MERRSGAGVPCTSGSVPAEPVVVALATLVVGTLAVGGQREVFHVVHSADETFVRNAHGPFRRLPGANLFVPVSCVSQGLGQLSTTATRCKMQNPVRENGLDARTP